MISSEYNWTDEYILDIPICRARQIAANIEARRKDEFRQQALLVEWSTRSIVQYVAATVPTAKGKSNELLKSASKLRLLLKGEDDSSPESSPELAPEEFVEDGSQVATERNRAGSFETLMTRMPQ